MTLQDAAQMLRVSPIRVRRYIATGRLQGVRIGRRLRVRRTDVDRLLAPAGRNVIRPRFPVPAGEPFTMDDPLWNIVGIGQSAEPTSIAEHKDDYVADAYAPSKE